MSILYPTVMFINAGNLALSLDYFAFGYDGFLRGILFQVVNTSLMYSLGVYMVGRHLSVKVFLRYPSFMRPSPELWCGFSIFSYRSSFCMWTKFLGDAALPILVLMLGYFRSTTWTSHASVRP